MLGDLYAEHQDFANAAKAFKRGTQINPEYAYAFGGLGASLYMQKLYSESIQPLQQSIRLKPEQPENHYYLGMSQLMLGQKTEAMHEYEALKKLNSDAAPRLLEEINQH